MRKALTIGLSLSLSGRYAAMGRQAEAGLRLFAADCNAAGGIELNGSRFEIAIDCRDDESKRDRAEQIYRDLVSNDRPDLLFSPYGSSLVRASAPIAEDAGMLFVNHGGADDELYRRGYGLIVGVLSPARNYMTGFVRLVSSLKFWRKRVAVISSATPFAHAVAAGAEFTCRERFAGRRRVRVRVKYDGPFDPERTGEALHRALRHNHVNVLLSAGSYEHDVAVMRFATSERLYMPVLGCVAAGVNRFYQDLGRDAEGIVGPAQWDADAEIHSTIGPTGSEFVRRFSAVAGAEPDYPAAQAYAAGVVTAAAIATANSISATPIRRAFADLRTTTFFGDFAIDRRTGSQVGHQMVLVQWHGGRKVVIQPEPDLRRGELEFPMGWRLLLGSIRSLRLKRKEETEDMDQET